MRFSKHLGTTLLLLAELALVLSVAGLAHQIGVFFKGRGLVSEAAMTDLFHLAFLSGILPYELICLVLLLMFGLIIAQRTERSIKGARFVTWSFAILFFFLAAFIVASSELFEIKGPIMELPKDQG